MYLNNSSMLCYYRNRSNFHGTNISRIPKMDSICDFIFTNPPLYNIHEFVFVLIEFQSFRQVLYHGKAIIK